MYYPFLEPFIREHFMLGPFRRKNTYLSLPIEGLGIYRIANITTDLPRFVERNPVGLPWNSMGIVPLSGETIQLGQVNVSRSFDDGHKEVEVWEHLRSGAFQTYLYREDRLIRIQHYFDQIATCAAYQDRYRWIDKDRDEEPAPAYTYFGWDDEGRLTDVDRSTWGLHPDACDTRGCTAKIEYQHDGDLVILTLEETFREPEQKYAWLFEAFINNEIIQELAHQEPGIKLARTCLSRAEYARDFNVFRFRR